MKGGIISPKIWTKDKKAGRCRRVLVILKEAPCGDSFNLRQHILDGAKAYTYNNVAMWVFLLQHFHRDNTDLSLKEALKKKNDAGRRESLEHAAIINISDRWQKSGKGKCTNDKILIKNHTAERHTEIENYISEIEPDIILCGGKAVVSCLSKYGELHRCSTSQTKYAKAYTYDIHGTPYPLISMPHPNAHFRQNEMYKDLKALLDEIQIR